MPILINPYGNINWETVKKLKADYHIHHEYDRNFEPVEDVIDMYNATGYTALCLSILPNWEDYGREPNQLGMIEVLGGEYAWMKSKETGNRQATHHIVFAYMGEKNLPHEDRELLTWEENLQEVDDRGGIAYFAHPKRYYVHAAYNTGYSDGEFSPPARWQTYAKEIEKYDSLIGLDIFDNALKGEHDVRHLWDKLNEYFSQKGEIVYGFNDDDFKYVGEQDRCINILLVDEITKESSKNAIKNGKFYISNRDSEGVLPEIFNINVDENKITINSENAKVIKWIENTKCIGTGRTFDINYCDNFVRAELYNDSGMTLTQPFIMTKNHSSRAKNKKIIILGGNK